MAEIDKVKLEQIIDLYLKDEVPLVFLLETYQLTYPQMQLLINRTTSYTKKMDKLYDTYPNVSYDNVSQDLIAIPHEVPEDYPYKMDDHLNQFKRLRALQESLTLIDSKILEVIDEEIKRCKDELASISVDDINRAEKIISDIEQMKANGDDFEDIFRINFISPIDFQRLNDVYCRYLELQERYTTLLEKRLEAETDIKASKKIKREIEDIRENLVVHNIKLVNFCSRHFFSGIPLPQDEVQLYGIEGLARAINGFDVEKGYAFSTYAVPAIVHTIQRNFKEMTGLTWKDYCRKSFISYYRNLYKKEIGSEEFEISARMLAESGLVPLTEREIKKSDQLIDGVVSMSDAQEPFDDEEDYGLRDFPMSFDDYSKIDDYSDSFESSDESLEREFYDRYIKGILLEIVMDLPVKEADIVIRHYGLNGKEPMSLREIGRLYNVGPETIRQKEVRAIHRLRHPSRSKRLRGLLEVYDNNPDYLDGVGYPPVPGGKTK